MRRLRQERERAKLSRAALGRLANVNDSIVRQIESGYIGRPYPSQIARIAEALRPYGWVGSPDDLLQEVDDGA